MRFDRLRVDQSVEDSLRGVASSSRPFDVVLGSPECGSSFWQCIFMLCPLQRNAELVRLHDAVRRCLVADPKVEVSLANKTYMPHLSLLYSDLVGGERESARGEAEELLRGQAGGDARCGSFQVGEFELYETPMGGTNTTKAWRRVRGYPLRGQGAQV